MIGDRHGDRHGDLHGELHVHLQAHLHADDLIGVGPAAAESKLES